MLGAAHSCANPLTARFDVVHGVAVGLMLPHVVKMNAGGSAEAAEIYASLDAADLPGSLTRLLSLAGLPTRLRDLGIPAEALPELAPEAAKQWTAQFNPAPAGEAELLALYRAAW